MASDWIDERDERLKKIEANSRAREDRNARETQLKKTFGPDLLKDLETMVRGHVEKWNAKFHDTIGVDKHPGGFTVSKGTFPRGFAVVVFNSETVRIEYELERSRPMSPNEMYKTEGYFPLAVCSTDALYIADRHRGEHLALEKISQMVIESVGDPQSHHLI